MRKSNKKGMELSMNVIIVAIIALIVLVVVLLIFTGKLKGVNNDLDSCSSKQGTCTPAYSGAGLTAQCPPDMAKVRAECPGELICCINFGI